jgi:rhamnose transport system substrate-binding protein
LVVNPVDCRTFSARLVDSLENETGPKGEIAIVTASFAAPNQMRWIQEIKRHIYSKYPGLTIYDIRTSGANTEEAYRITRDYLHEMPSLKGIIALGVLVAPGVAKAVEDAGLSGKVAVVGVSTPNLMRPYVKDGTVKTVLLWKAKDHGYLTVYSAYRLLTTGIRVNQPFQAGRLGTFTPQMDGLNMQVFLPTLVLTKANIDQYHF